MPSDLRATIEAAYDLHQRPKPNIAELIPVTKALTELRGNVTSDIRAHAGALGVRVWGDQLVQEIQQAYKAVVMALLDRHRLSELDLFLDIDGTDTTLTLIPPGRLDTKDVEIGSAFIDGRVGTIVARPGDLSAFEQSFRTDRGYSNLEAASTNHETTSVVNQAPVIEAAVPPIDSRNGEAERSAPGGDVNPENAEASIDATVSRLVEASVTEAPVDLTKPGSIITETPQTPSKNQRAALIEPRPKRRLLYGADLEKFMVRWPDMALERLSGAGIAFQYLADRQKRAQQGQAVPKLPHRRYIAVQAEEIRRRRLEKSGIAVSQKSK